MQREHKIKKVLLIDTGRERNQLLEKAIKSINESIEVEQVTGVSEALSRIRQEPFDMVFIDSASSKSDRDFLGEMKKTGVMSHVIVIVETGDELQAAEAIKGGAFDYLMKNSDYGDTVPSIVQRVENVFSPNKGKEEVLEQQSPLFKQIFRSQKWWQNIIDSITDYLFVINKEYRILRTNKAFASHFNKEPVDIIMKPYYELFGLEKPHDWCLPPDKMDSVTNNSVEQKIDGTYYLISSYPIFFDEHDAVVYIVKNITETRRLKDQIYHMDKLSSLGTLTSGVAHEINNPLTGIIGYTEMLLMNEKDETNRKYLQKVFDSAIRCKGIVENMLTFSRQTTSRKSPENINDIIDKTIDLLEYWLRSTNIEIVKKYDKVPFILMDRQQTQQVILNLLTNAEHAISETDRRGRIELQTEFDKTAEIISIKISDNGKGISEELQQLIFDPFFTTKPVNKGTGLGLSITHGIIAEQGGTIEMESEVEKGTSFLIKLPLTD